jgi:hypothetical protein
MTTFFLVCAVLGGGVLLLQLVLGLLGVDHHHELGGVHGHDMAEGLNLLSVRALSAGVGFFGIAGLAFHARNWAPWLALPLALAVGGLATVGVAVVMRGLLRLEDDGMVRVQDAVGQSARVYVGIPGARKGAGKVLMTLQNRTVELQAVTAQGDLPTGTEVTVIDVVGPDTVEVVVTPTLGELLDGSV